VQKTLEENLKYLYPNLEIQGEETPDSIKDIEPVIRPE